MSAIPLGALVVGSTDSPGPFRYRRNTIITSICINFLVVVITISLKHNPILIIIFIVLFGMFFSLIGIYGTRANAVGLIALLVFIFNIDNPSCGKKHSITSITGWHYAIKHIYAKADAFQNIPRRADAH